MSRRTRSTPRWTVLALTAALITPALLATAAPAQSLQQRIENVRRQRAQQEAQQQRGIRQRLRATLNGVALRDVTAREAFQWISANGNVPIVINWDRMQQAGVSPDQRVELTAERISVRGALERLVSQITFDRKPVLEITPWYVKVMSREEANQNTVIRVYPIGDLTMRTPNFTNAPEFDLQQITQGNSGGGTGGGGGGGIFTDTNQQDEEDELMNQPGFNPASRIADLIRNTVQPDLWRANGGLHGSITVFNNNLVIRAPKYVHRRIGGDPRATAARASSGGSSADGAAASASNRRNGQGLRRSNAGVDRNRSRPAGSDRRTSDGTAGVESQRPYPRR